jgi:hypothetical protein
VVVVERIHGRDHSVVVAYVSRRYFVNDYVSLSLRFSRAR